MPEPLGRGQRYVAGLDGLRAVAVAAVIAYHLGLSWAPGGLLGVGIFFTLSGYLITDLLLGSWGSTGRLELRNFWARRARRLLPALFSMLTVVTLWVAVADRSRLGGLRGDVAAALGYVSNWWLAFQHVSYFARFGPPSPLGHLWSLAVEEQFYLIWPWLLWLGLAWLVRRRREAEATVPIRFSVPFTRRQPALALAGQGNFRITADLRALGHLYSGRAVFGALPAERPPARAEIASWFGLEDKREGQRLWPLAAATLLLAAVSAVEMALLYHPSFDPSRVYDGTDTRAFGLLAGAALAMVWPSQGLTSDVSPAARRLLDLMGATGLLTIAVLIWRTNEYSAFLYRGGMVLLSMATVLVVASVTHPASRFGRLLGWRPLRWAGVRSYGMYLWHYPVIVLTAPAIAAGTDLPRLTLQVSVTVILAALSWRFIESPIRGGAIGRLWAQARSRRWRHLGPRAWAGLGTVPAVVLLGALGLAGVVPAVPAGPLGGAGGQALEPPTGPAATGGIYAKTVVSGRAAPAAAATGGPARATAATTATTVGTTTATTTGATAATTRPVGAATGRLTGKPASPGTPPRTPPPKVGPPPTTSARLATSTSAKPAVPTSAKPAPATSANPSAGPNGKTAVHKPVVAPAVLRSSCREVVHIGDSTSASLVSSDYLPDAAQRLTAQYARVGVTRWWMEIQGGTSVVETLPGEQDAYTIAEDLVHSGFHGCWVLALGTNDSADVYVGSNVGMAARIKRMMSAIGNQPVLWVNAKTLLPTGPYAETNMQHWDKALVAACGSYPNMRVFNWAAMARRAWFTPDGIHYNSPGSAPRAAAIADALAAAFPSGTPVTAGTRDPAVEKGVSGAARQCTVNGSGAWHLPAFKY